MSESARDIFPPGVANDLLAGSVAGAAQVIVGQPLDTIKTRAQIARRTYCSPMHKGSFLAERAVSQLDNSKGPWIFSCELCVRKGLSRCTKVRPRHMPSAYTHPSLPRAVLIGMAPPLLGVGAVNSLLFAAYAMSKRLVSPFGQLSIGEIALAGGIAGAVNAVLASPGMSSTSGIRRKRADTRVSVIYLSGDVQSANASTVWATWR
jgi:solute carrier family 25 carnitine/acylcarnitine transporter 20/29